jgi:hypothetical protein
MSAKSPVTNLYRLWALLIVMVIGLQATAPTAPSLHKTDGSAFSASTYEVALYVQRADRGQRQQAAMQPATSFAPVTVTADGPAPELVGRAHMRPDPTGPPLRDIHSWQPAPRGPPQA